jgi:hypothetical protein
VRRPSASWTFLKQNVGEAIAVEISGADRMPAWPRIAGAAASDHRGAAHLPVTTSPLLFCHRMSDRPSPLKSPVPIAWHLGPGLPASPLAITVVASVIEKATV